MRDEGVRSPLMREAVRFSGAGAANTLLTLLLYNAFLSWVSAPLAYTLSWLIGLSVIAMVYPAVVFRKRASRLADRAAVATIYITSFFIGLLVVKTIVSLGYDRAALFAALAITIPYNFILMRLVLQRPD